MKTLVEVLKLSTQFLQDRGVQRPRRISEEILSKCLKIKRLDLYLQFDRPLVESELDEMRKALQRAGRGEPVQYIFGEMDFFGCSLELTAQVLIPRQETEILVSRVLEELLERDLQLWDICCGSGCIGLSLAKAMPSASVTLSDLCPGALEVARKNAVINALSAQFLHGDLLAPFSGRKAHAIVCNPPYVSHAEYAHLDPSVRDFEPKMALVGGETGLEIYERMAGDLPHFLHPGGKVFFEIGSSQREPLFKIFSQGPWKRIDCQQDFAGKDRFFFLELE